MKISSPLLVLASIALLPLSLKINAQEMTYSNEVLEISIDTQDEDGVFYEEQAVQCFISLENKTAESLGLRITWEIATDDWHPLMERSLFLEIGGNASVRNYCPWYDFQDPGFYRMSAKVSLGDDKNVPLSMVVGIDPEKLVPSLDPPSGFMEFWEESIAELKRVKPEYTLREIKREGKTRTDLYEVEMKSFEGLTVRGWLEVPQKKGKYPAVLRVPGYTEDLKPLDKYDDLIIFSFNTRDHGNSDNTGERSYDMWVRGMESKEGYYYRGIFLDCIRALDYLESREDVTMDKIAIWGGSQGGGLSFAIAALDRRVAFCIADIPYMCDYPRYFSITHWIEIDHWFAEDPSHNWNLLNHTLSYFDTKYLAKHIKCPVLMGIGLQDDVCPPSTSFMTFNLIDSEKHYDIYKFEKHSQPASHYEDRFARIRKAFSMDQ